MLENQFAGIHQYQDCERESSRPRMRSYQIRLKQKRSDLDDYELKETIGEGGFGKVKKAIHKLTGEIVAVKIATIDQYEPDQLEAIQREIQLQKNLMHENIAQIYEVIRRDNKIYIFMEHCKNGELFDKINRTGPMAEKEAAKIFHQILSALLYLKESGLSHRDIKPENVLFDENWNVKLIDFGFSCLTNLGEFRRTICGTPSYTAPEIIKRQNYDAQLVDVWCLGVTLYAMLAAQLPFEGDTPEKRKANIVAFKFEQKAFFSVKVQKLFASIFVDSKHRAKLWDLKTCDFSLSYEPSHPHFIDFKSENIVVEDQIIEIIDREYHMDVQKVTESVKSCRFDKQWIVDSGSDLACLPQSFKAGSGTLNPGPTHRGYYAQYSDFQLPRTSRMLSEIEFPAYNSRCRSVRIHQVFSSILIYGIQRIRTIQNGTTSHSPHQATRLPCFDKYHAMYYLTLKHEKHTHKHPEITHLDEYKKQRKGSLIKLQPITRTPSLSKKSNSREKTAYTLSLKTSRVQKDGVVRMRPRKTIDPNTCRLRKDSPDSPRRLLDCLAAYKDC